jgi:hypothetical protein
MTKAIDNFSAQGGLATKDKEEMAVADVGYVI